MSSYAFWNTKGGVGKSFLCFVAAAEYAHRYPDTDVYVIDLCPQANVSEILLGGDINSPKALDSLSSKTPRSTVAGYLEARLNSPFRMISDVSPYICEPTEFNPQIPENLKLVCGDNLLEIISEAIRQTSELQIPNDAWKQVLNWIRDLIISLRIYSGERDTVFLIDCSPSFAIYTQLGLVGAEGVVVPFTAAESSLHAIENVVALLYGITDPNTAPYAKISFAKRAKEEGISVPKLYAFVLNQVTMYESRPASASLAINKMIQKTLNNIHQKNRHIFANPKDLPSNSFIEIPSKSLIEIPASHAVAIVAAKTGTPLHKLKPGPKKIGEQQVQLYLEPLQRYREALEEFVNFL
ncbi:MAG: ParA family protein [Nostoc sp.]|uniref:ParA family protein n=1 Tax=unclassified Nostoc TaxID=2593658 RepID=UPI0025FE29B0|nr:ParA family protein [Nostoc sp. NOS(2021)]MBN3897886.1 ParA family protein [Nostoc sp. NOS(2021)]